MPTTTTEAKMRAGAGTSENVEFEIDGGTALLTIIQPTFHIDGRFLGECRIAIEGRRTVGGIVEFATPPVIRVTNAPVATGLGGYHFHRFHRYPGAHPVISARFFA